MTTLYRYPCPDNNITCYPLDLTLPRGKWFIELWGAGTGNGAGYSSGILQVSQTLKLYVYLGGQEMPIGPQCGIGGYNGGGNASKYGLEYVPSRKVYYCRQSGGSGASDIRLIPNDLDSRIMVAGGSGGGSACNVTVNIHTGGCGGGLKGGTGTTSGTVTTHIIGYGGDQSNGGKGQHQGELGVGGAAEPSVISDCAAAGGGGYYGGGSGYDYELGAGGGGGSAYISGHKQCKPNSIRFQKPVMINGTSRMPQPQGGFDIGYIGTGVLRVTILSLACTKQLRPFASHFKLFIFLSLISVS